MLNGVSNFEWKRMKNLVNYQLLLFTRTGWHSKFGCNLCKIRWEKHHRAFVKVVEGSEIYIFPIHHLVHFYSIFWSFTRSNRGTVKQIQASRRRAATSRAHAHHARTAPSLVFGPTRAFLRTRAPRPPRAPSRSGGLCPQRVAPCEVRAGPPRAPLQSKGACCL
jgi:hypothetical protein